MNMSYPIALFRQLFEIATDVKDNKIEKAFFEADLLDILPQTDLMYAAILRSTSPTGRTTPGRRKLSVTMRSPGICK